MTATNGFQTGVASQPAVAIAGDFCDHNPRFTVDAGQGALVVGAAGLTIGRFAWATQPVDNDGAAAIVSNNGTGPVTGFVAREQQALITKYLDDASMVIAPGFMCTLYSGGGFWVVNDGATQALVGQTAYANYADGKVTFASAAAAASVTGTIAAGTFSSTGSITNEILTVTAGTVQVGGLITSGAAAGTIITSQLTGTPNGVGTYTLSIPAQTVSSTTISGTFGTFTAVSGLTGLFGIGDVLAGSGGGGVTAGTMITALGTGTGGLGTYIVQTTQTVTSLSITATLNVATKWVAMSSAVAGGLVKISDHLLG